MRSRIFTLVLALGGVAACQTTKPSGPQGPRQPYNILFVYSDDHASHAISAYGSRINQTPNIDRIASEGMLFRNCFVGNSICAPARATVLTGQHSHVNGVVNNGVVFDGSQTTFPKLLQRAGYQTAIVGKWHLKSDPTGFDHWEVLIGQGPYYNPPLKSAAGTHKHEGYTTEVITDRALTWLKEQRDPEQPFLLMYQHKAPHRDWMPGPGQLSLYDDVEIPEPPTLFDDYRGRTRAAAEQEMTIDRHLSERDLKLDQRKGLTEAQLAVWNEAYGPKNEAFHAADLSGDDLIRWKYQRYIKDYLRTIASIDEQLGRVLEYLEQEGLRDNTIVIYSSDQGFYLGDHGWYDKRWMYEESFRTPLIVSWPGVTPAGSNCDALVQNIDLAQTLLEMAGVEAPQDMQGRSLVPWMRGQYMESWRHSLYYHYYEYPQPHRVAAHYGVRTSRYKLIHYYDLGDWELFDLENDPQEMQSVYGDPRYAQIQAHLLEELRRLQEQYGDTEPTEAPVQRKRQARAQRAAAEVPRQVALHWRDGAAPPATPPQVAAKPLTVAAAFRPGESSHGVLVAQGGESYGYSLYLDQGRPHFAIRNEGRLFDLSGAPTITSGSGEPEEAVELIGHLAADGRMSLYWNGQPVAQRDGVVIHQQPADGLSLAADSGSPVGSYTAPFSFDGRVVAFKLAFGELDHSAMSLR